MKLLKFAAVVIALMSITQTLAFADPLTAAQTSALTDKTKAYFKALYSGGSLGSLTTTDYTIVSSAGKPISAATIAGHAAAVKMAATGGHGKMTVNSAMASSPSKVVEVVTLSGYADIFRGENPSTVAGTLKHQLTWVKNASGAWLVSQDKVLEASHT